MVEGSTVDLLSLLSFENRDFLVRNDGTKVDVRSLSGKIVGLYFSASWCPPCRGFTPTLSEVCQDLSSSKDDFEIIFVLSDRDEEPFNGCFSKMSWLAVPFSDSPAIKRLKEHFEVRGIPFFVVIDGAGNVLTTRGVRFIKEYGVEAYPFTPERIQQLKEKEELARINQTLQSVLVNGNRDYVISNGDKKVQVSELVGKHVLIYFSAHWCPPCRAFTPELIEAYNEIKANESNFEFIFVSSDRDNASFKEYYSSMPWLALPYGDQRKSFLSRRFKVDGIPTLVATGPNGPTVTIEARELVMEYGANAFPFTEEHINELELKNKEIVSEEYVCDGDVCRRA